MPQVQPHEYLSAPEEAQQGRAKVAAGPRCQYDELRIVSWGKWSIALDAVVCLLFVANSGIEGNKQCGCCVLIKLKLTLDCI